MINAIVEMLINLCDKQRIRLQHGFFKSATSKSEIFAQYKEKIIKASQTGAEIPVIDEEQRRTLAKHRFFGASKETKSIRKLVKMEKLLVNINAVNEPSIQLSNGFISTNS